MTKNKIAKTYTRSPVLKLSTQSPTASTSPAISLPRTTGNVSTMILYFGIFHSTGFKATDCIFISISPGAGVGILICSRKYFPDQSLSSKAFCMDDIGCWQWSEKQSKNSNSERFWVEKSAPMWPPFKDNYMAQSDCGGSL